MIALALQAVAAFNLTCAGMVGDSSGREEQETMVLRIDLEHRQWCADECVTIDPIVELTDSEIVLWDQSASYGRSRQWVNRQSGALTLRTYDSENELILWRQGTCRREPFGGFPKGSIPGRGL